jgi:hypothetical protein
VWLLRNKVPNKFLLKAFSMADKSVSIRQLWSATMMPKQIWYSPPRPSNSGGVEVLVGGV